jgi:hypothetical protein
MHRDRAKQIVRMLDRTEADMRGLESRLTGLRMELVKEFRLTGADRGFVEGEDEGLRPHPSQNG